MPFICSRITFPVVLGLDCKLFDPATWEAYYWEDEGWGRDIILMLLLLVVERISDVLWGITDDDPTGLVPTDAVPFCYVLAWCLP